jgi:hypothetical protein
MIRSAFATRWATMAGVALSVAGLGALDAGAQGTVTLSGATGNSCTATSISIGTNGSLNVTCQTSNPGDPPACSISGPTTGAVGQAFTLNANCSPAATSYTWTGASANASSVSITPQVAGTLSFTVTGTNANGTGVASAVHSVSVTSAPPPPADVPKNCTFSANPAQPQPGQATTLTISCTNSPNAFAWYQYEGSTLSMPNQTAVGTQTVTFPSAGTYKWWLQAGNQMGGGDVFAGQVTVGSPTGSCAAVPELVGPQSSASLLNLRFDLRPGQTGTQSFPLPLDGVGSARITGTPATSSETPKSTIAEVWVSECPGVKPADLPAGCMMELWGSTGQANFYVGDSPWSSCPLAPNKTYHVNIKHRTCVPSGGSINYCSHYLKVSGQ